jgi:hypothetical protein
MEWSDERRKGRESGQRSGFPSLNREDATTCVRQKLLVDQFPVSAAITRCAGPCRLLSLGATFLFLRRDESPTSECRLWRRIG